MSKPSPSSSSCLPFRLVIRSLIICLMSLRSRSGILDQEPVAIFALKVCEDILCCRWPTSCRPSEKARSASTDEAVVHRVRSIRNKYAHACCYIPGVEQKSEAIRARQGQETDA